MINSFNDPVWDLRQLAVWVAFRDQAVVDHIVSNPDIPVAAAIETAKARPLTDAGQAEKLIRQGLFARRLSCAAALGDNRVEVPKHVFLAAQFLHEANALRNPKSGEEWTDLRFRRAEILRIWSARSIQYAPQVAGATEGIATAASLCVGQEQDAALPAAKAPRAGGKITGQARIVKALDAFRDEGQDPQLMNRKELRSKILAREEKNGKAGLSPRNIEIALAAWAKRSKPSD
jgi:hypothetical protein